MVWKPLNSNLKPNLTLKTTGRKRAQPQVLSAILANLLTLKTNVHYHRATMDIPASLLEKLRPLRLLVLDVDGVLTDGSLLFHPHKKEESKAFSTQDGQGLKLLQASGVELAIITGRSSKVVQKRAKSLGIQQLLMGREDKITALAEILHKLNLDWHQVGYCGDDLPDLAAIRKAGFGATVANAPTYIQQYSDYTTHKSGGQGAVRELTDLIMHAQGTWSECLNHYLYNLRAN